MPLPDTGFAYRIQLDRKGYRAGLQQMPLSELSAGDVTIKVQWSSVNYKDALAGTGKGKILRSFPLNGGIDVAGVIVSSSVDNFKIGDEVLVTGCGLSETRDGGYSEYFNADSQWLIPCPEGLDLREAMILGTAGFTAALCLWRMEQNGQTPEQGPIVVTGASGGVGSLAISLLNKAGYEVHAISSKTDQFDYLQSLGATQCISSRDLHWGENPLEKARWAGAIDNLGADMLNGLTRVIKPWGNITSCGMAAGFGLQSTVMPFIIRGISLLGINSSQCPLDIRLKLWENLGSCWKPPALNQIVSQEISLEELDSTFATMLSGKSLGRTLVNIDS
ncbi:MAG: YhdH/YhfP family quinone oxidoreductase [Xanthomonadales bacterium]|nr:YhdH/YhfP family quinone oxidoreductase [Xanthomonadales bacterium]